VSTVPGPSVKEWRDRLMPETALGMAMLILAFSVGAAFSGVVFFSYYQFRKDRTEEKVNALTKDFNSNFKNAIKTIQKSGADAREQIQKELEPLQRIRAEGDTLEALVKKVRPSLFFVSSLDEGGAATVGTGFVVASDSNQSLLLTSYSTVRAATHAPGPPITVRQGDQQVKATLWTWQEDKDLALLILQKGNVPRLPFAPRSPVVKTGDRIFALSGLGASGGSISQGFVADVSSAGIQHDAAIGPSFQGGPLLNSKGEVLAVASRTYTGNLGFVTDDVFFAIPIRAACDKVLKCPSDDEVSGAGAKR
jgi:S1-C subfamily serine protease